MDKEIVTVISALRNTIHRWWYHYSENLDKRNQIVLESAISGKYRYHYLCLLKQSYSTMPKNLGRQAKSVVVWCPQERVGLTMKHDQNNLLTDY